MGSKQYMSQQKEYVYISDCDDGFQLVKKNPDC